MEIMSGNLTKYQLLQHRHLSLLQELQDAGVEAKCDPHGYWKITTRHRVVGEFPRIPTMDEWQRGAVATPTMDDPGATVSSHPFAHAYNIEVDGVPYAEWAANTMRTRTIETLDRFRLFANHNPDDWLVDVPKLYKGIAPPPPGLPSDALSDRTREYAKLKYAYDAGDKTIKASRIPTIIKSLYNAEAFAASMPHAPIPELDDNPEGRWTLSLTLADGRVRGWASGREYNVPADAKARDLLRCLSGVIFAAPAKA
jgi:hypothetical protein